jgi:NADP-dependent 3-hydroxy acid dehydrogenase YdfG
MAVIFWRKRRASASWQPTAEQNMDHFAGKTAVITGAAEGIGRAIAQKAGAEGMALVLADVNAASLAKTAEAFREQGFDVLTRTVDVARSEEVEALAAAAFERYGKVHLLVNNAGVALSKTAWQTSQQDWDWVMGVNFYGVTNGLRSFIPPMLEQNEDAHVVNVASLAGLISLPSIAAYNASKFAVVTVSEGLFHDLALRKAKIGVTVLCPAWVKTGIANSERNRGQGAVQPTESSDATAQMISGSIMRAVESGIEPADVAEKLFASIRAGQLYCLTHEGTGAVAKERGRDIFEGRNPVLPRL